MARIRQLGFLLVIYIIGEQRGEAFISVGVRCNGGVRSTSAPRCSRSISSLTRLGLKGGKIFGEEEEENVVIAGIDEDTADTDDDDKDEGFLADEKAMDDPAADRSREVVEALLESFPQMARVSVDSMGNVLETSKHDPYKDNAFLKRGAHVDMGVGTLKETSTETETEDTDMNIDADDAEPARLREGEWPEVAGDIGGMDDPADAPWRRKAEAIIREKTAEAGLNCYDIMWSFHRLEVTVTRGDLPEDDDDAGYVESDDLMKAIRSINDALFEEEDELRVLTRHELIIATPGAKDVLTTDREFVAFKGFDVEVLTGSAMNIQREVRGKLLERTFDELIITQNGRKVRIPLALVDEVRLPKAMTEEGEWSESYNDDDQDSDWDPDMDE